MIAGALTANNLNILSARITTRTNGVAMDVFRVSHQMGAGSMAMEEDRWLRVERDLERVITGQQDIAALVAAAHHVQSAGRKFVRHVPTEVTVDNRTSEQFTVIDVFTQDRVGLLFAITHTLYRLGLRIHLARISTNADQALDVFYVSDREGGKIEDLDRMRELRAALLEKVEQNPERRSNRVSAAGWDELIDRHLSRQAVERGLSRHSMDAYAHDLSVFQSWCREAGLTPAQLDAATLTAYLEALADRGLAVSSQRRHLASLRGLARELVDEKIIERDPAPAVKLRPHPRKLPRTLSPGDVENLIAAIDARDARGLRDRAMLEMAYGCGLRVSELVGLQLHQVNLAAGAVVVFGKGGKERMVPMGGAAIRALKAYLERRDEILNPIRRRDARQEKSSAPRLRGFHHEARPRDDPAGIFQGAQRMGRRRSAACMGQPAYLAPLLRHASARGRRRSARRAGDARPQRHLDHADLHPSLQEPPAQGTSHVSSARDPRERGGRHGLTWAI